MPPLFGRVATRPYGFPMNSLYIPRMIDFHYCKWYNTNICFYTHLLFRTVKRNSKYE